jgi:dienelactone hydrolase
VTRHRSSSVRALLVASPAIVLLAVGHARGQQPPAADGPVVPATPEVFQAVSQFYGYDAAAPLEADTVARQNFPGYSREKVVFTGVQRSRVPGYLALPSGMSGRVPVVLLIDGVGGSKERWFQEDSWPHGAAVTRALTGAGIAVLALDARYHGERAAENGYRAPQFSARPTDRDMIVQSIVEHRRAMDYLATRAEIDADRIGLLGMSMGGIMTFALSSMDSRVKAAVAGVTPIRPMKEILAIPIAPMTFAPAIANVPFLMLMGRTDSFYSVEDAHALLALIKSPRKALEVYESGHRLPAQYVARAVDWLQTTLQ